MGQRIRVERWINVELPRTQNLRVDLLGEPDCGELVHFELQSSNVRHMPSRMLEYAVAMHRAKGRFPVQILIYAGNEPLRIPNRLHATGIKYEFDVVDLKAMDGTALLQNGHLSDNLMALLMSVEDKVAVIQRIVARIIRLPEEKRLDAITRLLLTCRMRALHHVAEEEVKKMPIVFDIATDSILGPSYRKGRADGKGHTLRNQIRTKFGASPDWAEERLTASTEKQMDALAVRLLKSNSLEQLFRVAKQKS